MRHATRKNTKAITIASRAPKTGELQKDCLIQMEGSLHKYRAEKNDRGGDAKNF